jgi:hypothetical protein
MEVSGQINAQAALLPGKEPPVPIGQDAGWIPTLKINHRRRTSREVPGSNFGPETGYLDWDFDIFHLPSVKIS